VIEITFYTQDQKITGFESKGHANYAPEGQDIVCSAVSAVLIGLLSELERYGKPEYTIKAGNISAKTIPNKETQVLMEYAANTLNGVQIVYPDYVKVDIK